MDFDPQKIIANPLFPGALGAAVGLRFAPGLGWTEKVLNVASGAACAGFIAPAAGEIFRLTSVTMIGCLAFFIGMFGMSIAAAVTTGLREVKVGQILTGWISRPGAPKE